SVHNQYANRKGTKMVEKKERINGALAAMCGKCAERASAFGWKGKTGDKLAFEFCVGWVAALTEMGKAAETDAKFLSGYVAWIIAVRGLFEVKRIAAEAAAEAKEAA